MLYALLNGEKIEASPKLKAKCPLCEHEVFARCGCTNVNHWAHYEAESCEPWSEPETLWHKRWKDIFGKEHSEVIVEKGGKKHIADVLTSTNVVIEFQNSPISTKVIESREAFYGERMLWVINGFNFKDNFLTFYYPDERSEGRKDVGHSTGNWESENDKDIRFEWKQPRRTWMGAERPRFIDFGDTYLFRIKEWNAQRFGGGIWVSKEKFVEKYGGNKTLLKE